MCRCPQEQIKKLEKNHAKHIAGYGEGNERRLTGKHETSSMCAAIALCQPLLLSSRRVHALNPEVAHVHCMICAVCCVKR